MRIYKYTLPIPNGQASDDDEESAVTADHTTSKVDMPKGAEVLSVKTSSGKVRVFALVEPEAEVEEFEFEVWPIGVEIPEVEKKEYYATFFKGNGKAYHVYQKMA